jgi:eukaryotic-like serine/threonine-protein kinase
MASQWIWPFELQEKLGEGGMGVVYRARYVGNNRIVAVKLLPKDVADNQTMLARFERELEILQQLKHPNIVNCFGGVCESKQRFYAMELVEGGTLGELLVKRQKLHWDTVIEYALQMCAALQYAHSKGVIHRDIKPGNFLLTKNGQLKLSDFGLATMVAATRITSAGKTAGTFQYMAPEQIRGKPPVSAKSDLYALGCVLFELLTGAPPFGGETPAEVLHKHLKDPPPSLASLVPDCPAAMVQLVKDLLAKDPEQRPTDAAEVSHRLKEVLKPTLAVIDPFARTPAGPISTTRSNDDSDDLLTMSTTARSKRWPWSAIITTGVLVLLAGFGWWRASIWKNQWVTLEQEWLALAKSGNVRAIERLQLLTPWTRTNAKELLPLLESTDPEVRAAVARALGSHPEQSALAVGALQKMHGRDIDDAARFAAGQAATAIKTRRQNEVDGVAGGWLLGLGVLMATGSAAWWFWLRPEAASAARAQTDALGKSSAAKANGTKSNGTKANGKPPGDGSSSGTTPPKGTRLKP